MMNIFVLALGALASNYPPDYEVSRSCQSDKHVQVCAINRGIHNPRLEVTYYDSGSLWEMASPITLFATVNGRRFQAVAKLAELKKGTQIVGAQYTINQLKKVHYCYHATVKDDPEYAPGGPRCPTTTEFPLIPDREAKQGEMVWYSEPAPAYERELVSDVGAWNTEFSFVNDRGDKDSNSEQRYKFTFA